MSQLIKCEVGVLVMICLGTIKMILIISNDEFSVGRETFSQIMSYVV